MAEGIIEKEPLVEKLNTEKEVALNFQKRRHSHWNDNYTLYRDFVETNRLIQRQAVNVPLMKETIKTLLSKIDEVPDIVFEAKEEEMSEREMIDKVIRGEWGGEDEKLKEIAINERWQYDFWRLKMELIDIVDKKNVLLYGRSFKKLNYLDKEFDCDVLDIYDVLIDPKTSPLNIETARYIIHQNINKPLNEILTSDKYEEEGKEKLKIFLTSEEGLVASGEAKERLEEKAERLKTLGSEDYQELEELLSGSEVIVPLDEHYTNLWDEKKKKFVRYLIILAFGNIVLLRQPLKEIIGVEFYPFVSWADDLEGSDIWSDSVGDILRTPNKVINAWISQLIENRTLRNYGMFAYDATADKTFIPQTFEPKPFGLYPFPGDPNKVLKQIEIPDLKDSIQEMTFLIQLMEKASAATAIEKGVSEKKQITLGEVEILVGKAMERISNISKFYRLGWKEFAEKWYEILEANESEAKTIKLSKVSAKGNLFGRTIKPSDWKSKAGYRVKVLSSAEQEAERTSTIQKLMAVKQMFPENSALQKIAQRKILDLLKLSPEEINQVLEEEKKRIIVPPVSSEGGRLKGPIKETAEKVASSLPAGVPA